MTTETLLPPSLEMSASPERESNWQNALTQAGEMLQKSRAHAVAIRDHVVEHTSRLMGEEYRFKTTLNGTKILGAGAEAVLAIAEGNPAQLFKSVSETAVAAVMLYSKQGLEVPEGKNIAEQWKDAIKNPHSKSRFFQTAAEAPMIAVDSLVNFAMAAQGETERLAEFGVQAAIFVASAADELRETKTKPVVSAQATASQGSMAPAASMRFASSTSTSYFRTTAKEAAQFASKALLNKTTALGIGLADSGHKLAEGIATLSVHHHSAEMMIASSVLQAGAAIGTHLYKSAMEKRAEARKTTSVSAPAATAGEGAGTLTQLRAANIESSATDLQRATVLTSVAALKPALPLVDITSLIKPVQDSRSDAIRPSTSMPTPQSVSSQRFSSQR